MMQRDIQSIRRKAIELVERDITNNIMGFSWDTRDLLHILHEYYIEDMGDEYDEHRGLRNWKE